MAVGQDVSFVGKESDLSVGYISHFLRGPRFDFKKAVRHII